MAKTNELTPEGYQKLQDELAEREGKINDEIVERIKTARDYGDLSENSEYDDARDEQAKNNARINEIRNILSTHKIVENDSARADVSLGCTVEIKDNDTKKTATFTIVGTTEADSLNNKISSESPVGDALTGHAEGDTVKVTLPSGKTKSYTIVKITR